MTKKERWILRFVAALYLLFLLALYVVAMTSGAGGRW